MTDKPLKVLEEEQCGSKHTPRRKKSLKYSEKKDRDRTSYQKYDKLHQN